MSSITIEYIIISLKIEIKSIAHESSIVYLGWPAQTLFTIVGTNMNPTIFWENQTSLYLYINCT